MAEQNEASSRATEGRLMALTTEPSPYPVQTPEPEPAPVEPVVAPAAPVEEVPTYDTVQHPVQTPNGPPW